jgi:deoxyribose-phosphate aldolase
LDGVASVKLALEELALQLGLTRGRMASLIDATILSPTATLDDARRLIREVEIHGFYCAMLPPALALRIAAEAGRVGVRVCSVAGFPYGYSPAEAKALEVRSLAEAGVEEVDVVLNLTAVRSGEWGEAERELGLVAEAAHSAGARVKVIVEAPLLSDEELERVADIAGSVGVDYLKTSTGVISKGGDPRTVARLARAAAPRGIPVKAAGGIRGWLDAVAAIAAGASRIGSSSYMAILREAPPG